MATPNKSTEAATPGHERGRRSFFRLAVIGFLLLAIIILSVLWALPDTRVTWLTRADVISPHLPIGLLRLKSQLKALTAPIWQRFRRDLPRVYIRSNILSLSRSAAEQISLGAPVSTNADGMRAWILSSTELKAFNQRISAIPGASSRNAPTFETSAGGQAQVSAAQAIPADLNLTNTTLRKYVSVGSTVDMIPKVISGSVSLKLAVSSTELKGWTSEGTPEIKTNLAAACRVLIPSGGGLVLDGGNVRNTDGTNYWLIVSPTIVDTQGKPVKP